MKASATKFLGAVLGGGAVGFALGGPAGAFLGALAGSVAEGAWNRAKGRPMFGSEDGTEGAPTIEGARYAKQRLKEKLFSMPDVPWWLIGVGIGGQPGNYFVLVSVSDTPPDIRRVVPTMIEGVPVAVDATGAQSLEMSTSL